MHSTGQGCSIVASKLSVWDDFNIRGFFVFLLGYFFILRTIIGSWGGVYFARVLNFLNLMWVKLSYHAFDLDDVDKDNFLL